VTEESDIKRDLSVTSIQVNEVSQVTLIPNSALVDRGSIEEAMLDMLLKSAIN
jgi:hypothetical protein